MAWYGMAPQPPPLDIGHTFSQYNFWMTSVTTNRAGNDHIMESQVKNLTEIQHCTIVHFRTLWDTLTYSALEQLSIDDGR